MSQPTGTSSAAPTIALPGGGAVDVATLVLTHEPVSPEQDGGTHPTTGVVPLGTLAGTKFGVWEMSTGTMFDVEAEEIFVVTSGCGQVIIEPFNGWPEQTIDLSAGTLMRLSEGMRTTWTVTETLRKVYVTPGISSTESSSDGRQA